MNEFFFMPPEMRKVATRAMKLGEAKLLMGDE